MEWHLCTAGGMSFEPVQCLALTLISVDKNSLGHFRWTDKHLKKACAKHCILLTIWEFWTYYAIAVKRNFSSFFEMNFEAIPPPPDYGWFYLACFSLFASDGRNWISVTETNSRSQINRWFPYFTRWWITRPCTPPKPDTLNTLAVK